LKFVRCVVVVPTYNEKENIQPFLAAVRSAVPLASILVVDDNSPDGTGGLAEQTAAELGQIKVMHRPGKQGLGSAYRNGFTVALDEGYEVIVSMDVDFSHDPAVIPALLAAIDAGADAVVGSRYVAGGATADWPLHRRVLSRWGNRYTGAVLGLRVRDCTSGFRAYRATAMRDIDPASTSAEGYAFLTELIRRLVVNGHPVTEVPIVFRDREFGTSKMSSRIIAESMLLVTRWGVSDIVHRRRPSRQSRRSPGPQADRLENPNTSN
jgi:dolichol-phosphate mannosyltransferase